MIGAIASIAMLWLGVLIVLRMTLRAVKATEKTDNCSLPDGLEDDAARWPVGAVGWTALDEVQLVRLLKEA